MSSKSKIETERGEREDGTAIKNNLIDALEMEEKVTLIFYCFSLSLSFFLPSFCSSDNLSANNLDCLSPICKYNPQ